MAADPPDTDPADRDPRERGLERRSETSSLGPWAIVFGILILGALVYVISAL